MQTIYGESPEIQADDSYEGNGGVSILSVGDDEGNTVITGGSGQGEQETAARLHWEITIDSEGNYVSGGITGSNDWMRDNPRSPFIGFTDQQLADMARTTGSLDGVFEVWNDGDYGKIFTFMAEAWERTNHNCVSGWVG